MSKPLTIAIAGAGIGGLTAAALLADQGHKITVYDQFDSPKPVGSGLVIQPVGQTVLDRIGAGDAAREMGNPITRMLGHETDHGRRVLDVWYDRKHGRRFGLAIHRAALFDAILKSAQKRDITLVTSTKVTGRNGQNLIFASGHDGPFDLIIDALGASSTLSSLVGKPQPYGAIWGTVDWPKSTLRDDYLSQKYRSANRMIGALPIGSLPGDPVKKAAIFWSMPAQSHGDWQQKGIDAWKAEATELWPDFAPFLAQITDTNQMTMASYSHGTLKQPFGDGIAHIGDAAHRTSPQLGQGANMALLDALALAEAIKRVPLQDALPLYAKSRRWHVRVYQMMSWAFTPQYQSDSRFLPKLRDNILFPLSMTPPIPRVLTGLVCGNLLPPLASLGPL